jgi:hypothetical protein
MSKGSKFIVGDADLVHEGPDAGDWVRDVAEIAKNLRTNDPTAIFEARAEQLRRRAAERIKAMRPATSGGRPPGQRIDVQELKRLQGRRTLPAFARDLGISVNTLERVYKEGRGSESTKDKIENLREKKSPQKPNNDGIVIKPCLSFHHGSSHNPTRPDPIIDHPNR